MELCGGALAGGTQPMQGTHASIAAICCAPPQLAYTFTFWLACDQHAQAPRVDLSSLLGLPFRTCAHTHAEVHTHAPSYSLVRAQ